MFTFLLGQMHCGMSFRKRGTWALGTASWCCCLPYSIIVLHLVIAVCGGVCVRAHVHTRVFSSENKLLLLLQGLKGTAQILQLKNQLPLDTRDMHRTHTGTHILLSCLLSFYSFIIYDKSPAIMILEEVRNSKIVFLFTFLLNLNKPNASLMHYGSPMQPWGVWGADACLEGHYTL